MKPRTLIPIALILLSWQQTFAEWGGYDRDSLRAIVFDYSLPDTTRLQAGYKLVNSFLYAMPDSILHYSKIFYNESIKADYVPGRVRFTAAEGWYYHLNGMPKEALKCYLNALKIAEEYDQPMLLAFAAREVGAGYGSLSMYDKSSEYLLKAITIYREINDLDAIKNEIPALNNLASAYFHSGHKQQAIEACMRIVTLVDSLKLRDTNDKSAALNLLGILYMKSGNHREAIRSLNEALKLHQQNNNPHFYFGTLINMAYFFTEDTLNLYGKEIGDSRKSADIALAYVGECESWFENIQDSSKLAECQAISAKAYLMKEEKMKALERMKGIEQWYQTGKNIGPETKGNLLTALSNIYAAAGDYKKALAYWMDYVVLVDSMNKVEMSARVSQLTESFEIEQMEGQLSQKEQQLAKNRVITFLFIGISALILILAAIVSYFLRQKQRQNREIEKARRRAEQSEKFKERFLASMSHEIRTPLNAVVGMTDLLLDDPQPPKTATFLRNIKQAGEHLTGIINEILDLSRIDAGKLELHEAPFSMNELMEEMGNLLGGKAKEKALQLIIHKGEGTPDWVCGDAGRIRQVLLNLAGNAIKFTEQGSVQIKMTAGEPGEGKAIFGFSVEDTGVGIPKDMQAVIFEEFVQAGRSEDQRIIGTGLGLSIARKLVERMGGTLALESEPGKGSVFSFNIPLGLSTQEEFQAFEREKDLSVMVMKGSFRILVVEDNPSNQIVTEGLLEKILPESVAILAEDGSRALALLEKEKFDLVLMDIRMPGIDGYETTRRLRLLKNENAAIPVIALTASVIRSDIQHCLEAGMNGYVPKPVSRTFLAKILHEHLKIVAEEGVIIKEPEKENFLEGITNRPAWAERLYDICNGKKDRFIQLLNIFLEQSETETGNWQEWTIQQQYERLSFSIHKLLPHIRIFMEEESAAMAVILDQELRKGWSESYAKKILVLKEAILVLHSQASELLKEIGQ